MNDERLAVIRKDVAAYSFAKVQIHAGVAVGYCRELLKLIEQLQRATRTRPDYNFRCQECGAPHILDTAIPSEIWNKIAPDLGALCTLCIDERMAAMGLKGEAEFYFMGQALESRSYGELK